MRFTIIQTNTTRVECDAVDVRTGKTFKRVTTHQSGRIIAQHNSPETTTRHAERIRKRFPHIEVQVIEAQAEKVA